MRTGKLLAIVAVAALGLGALNSHALAGKRQKRSTGVVFAAGSPTFMPGGEVSARGTMKKTAEACRPGRRMRLELTDSAGRLLATLGTSTSAKDGDWHLQGHLPDPLPSGAADVRVHTPKRLLSRYRCGSGSTFLVPLPAG